MTFHVFTGVLARVGGAGGVGGNLEQQAMEKSSQAREIEDHRLKTNASAPNEKGQRTHQVR